MRYVIPFKTNSGVFMKAEGRTPMAALRALGKDRSGKLQKFANASQYREDGTVVLGHITRDGRAAVFEAE
jgi:hypothetical protein